MKSLYQPRHLGSPGSLLRDVCMAQHNVTVRVRWQAAARPAGFIRAVNGAFVDDACKEFFPVGWNSCALPHPLLFPHL